MTFDIGRIRHLAEQMHRSEDDAGDPIPAGKLLAATGDSGLEWVDPSGSGTDLGWFNVMDYGATGDGTTDDTSAVQDTIDACAAAGGGTVWFPYGEYVISGSLQDTGARNAQLLLPTVSTAVAQMTIRLLGAARPPFAVAGPAPDPGQYSIIRSTLTGASGTAACISGGNQVFTSKNNLQVVIEDLLFMAPDNPTFTFINIMSCQGGAIHDVMITMTSWSSATVPSNSNAYGIKLPQRGQSNYTYVDGLCVYIFYTGVQIGELTVAKGLIFAGCQNAVELTSSPHPSLIVEMHQTGCVNGITVTGGSFPVSSRVLLYNAEHMGSASGALRVTTYDFNDSGDDFVGDVTWLCADNSGPVDHVFNVNGGASGIFTEVGFTSEPTADAHIADTTDAHDASAVSVADAGGYFTSTEVEGALQEVGADIVALASVSGIGDHEHMIDVFNGDASTTVFEISDEPIDPEAVFAFVGGSWTAITVSGTMNTTITFGSAPGSGTGNVVVQYPAVSA